MTEMDCPYKGCDYHGSSLEVDVHIMRIAIIVSSKHALGRRNLNYVGSHRKVDNV